MFRAVSRLVFPDVSPGSDGIGLAGIPSTLSVTVCWNDASAEHFHFSEPTFVIGRFDVEEEKEKLGKVKFLEKHGLKYCDVFFFLSFTVALHWTHECVLTVFCLDFFSYETLQHYEDMARLPAM